MRALPCSVVACGQPTCRAWRALCIFHIGTGRALCHGMTERLARPVNTWPSHSVGRRRAARRPTRFAHLENRLAQATGAVRGGPMPRLKQDPWRWPLGTGGAGRMGLAPRGARGLLLRIGQIVWNFLDLPFLGCAYFGTAARAGAGAPTSTAVLTAPGNYRHGAATLRPALVIAAEGVAQPDRPCPGADAGPLCAPCAICRPVITSWVRPTGPGYIVFTSGSAFATRAPLSMPIAQSGRGA